MRPWAEAWVVRGMALSIYAAEYSAACGSSKRMPCRIDRQRPNIPAWRE